MTIDNTLSRSRNVLLALVVVVSVISVPVQTASAAETDTIDDFEDGGLTEYSGDTGDFAVNTNSPVENGSYSLKSTLDAPNQSQIGSGSLINANSSTGLQNTPDVNQTFSTYIRPQGDEGVAAVAWGIQDSGAHYRLQLDNGDTEDIMLIRDDGGSNTQLAQLGSGTYEIKSDRWYWVEITWGSSTIQAEVFDGTTGQRVANLTADDSTFTDGDYGYIYGSDSAGSAGQWAFDNAHLGSGSTNTRSLSGQVVDQNGDSVSNATVIGYASRYPSTTESRDKLKEFSDPIPQDWIDQGKSDVSLIASNGVFKDNPSYVAVHESDALRSTAPWIDSADLSQPALKLPANEKIILSAWDGTAGGFGSNTCIPAPGGSEYDCQMPGEHKQDTKIVVERIDGSGNVVMKSEFKTKETAGGGFADPDQFNYATAELKPGFYRFYEKGSSNKGLVHMVGDPTAIIQESTENIEGQLTDQAQKVDDALNTTSLQRVSTTTGSDGSFSLDIASDAKIVTVQAVKTPDVLNTEPSNVDIQTITTEYNTALTATDPTDTQKTLLNSSVYFPSRTRTVEPPKSDVVIRMTELSSPPGANATALQDQIKRLRNRLQNQSFSDLRGSLQEQLENVDRDRLENLHGELDTLREQNDQLERRYEALLEDQLDTDNPNLNVNLNDTSDAELRSRIQALQQTVTELQSTVEAGPGEITSSTDTVTYRQRFGSPLENPDQVSVIADWSNGTSQVVGDKYISVNNDPENIAGFGGSEIVVEDFPVGSSDPKALSFRVVGATEDGFAKKTKQVKNPTFSGELPSLQSISVNSLEPASNETVNLKVNPGERSIQEVSDLTVFGPNGQETGSPSVDGRTATFTTDAGTGVYSVRATLTTADGVSTTETLRLPVADTDKPRKPSIRAKESPLGAYAIVGDGISDGDVTVENGGSSVTVLAELKDDADVPPRLHVYTESLSLASDADTTVRVVRGSNQESVSRHVRVTLHSQSVPEDALIWRNDQPIPIDAESQYGTAKTTGRGLSIRTYTDGSGVVSVRSQTDPSLIDQAQFWVASNVNLDSLNPLMTSPAATTMPGSRTASATAKTAS